MFSWCLKNRPNCTYGFTEGIVYSRKFCRCWVSQLLSEGEIKELSFKHYIGSNISRMVYIIVANLNCVSIIYNSSILGFSDIILNVLTSGTWGHSIKMCYPIDLTWGISVKAKTWEFNWEMKYGRISVARTSLAPLGFVLDISSKSHWGARSGVRWNIFSIFYKIMVCSVYILNW